MNKIKSKGTKAIVIALLLSMVMTACGQGNKEKPAPQKEKETIEQSSGQNNDTTMKNSKKEEKKTEKKIEKKNSGIKKEPQKPEKEKKPKKAPQTKKEDNLVLSPEEYLWIYQDILDDAYLFIAEDEGENFVFEGRVGLWEKLQGKNSEEFLENIGYAITDISGDGIPELIVAEINPKKDDISGSEVIVMYTLNETYPQYVMESFEGRSYIYVGENRFYMQETTEDGGSSFGMFRLESDGTGLICEDFYFTSDSGTKPMKYYQNSSGRKDVKSSKELSIKKEEIQKIQSKMKAGITELSLKSFYEYSAIGRKNVQFQVKLINDSVKRLLEPFEYFAAEEGEYTSEVLFRPHAEVKNVKILSLEYIFDESGKNVKVESKVLHHYDKLTPEKPLVVKVAFYEFYPRYGISFEDADGTWQFGVDISAKDGSLVIDEF